MVVSASSALDSSALRPLFAKGLKFPNSPTKPTKSTTTEHYRVWQGIKDPNQDLNNPPIAHYFLFNLNPSTNNVSAFLSPTLLFCLGSLMWKTTKR